MRTWLGCLLAVAGLMVATASSHADPIPWHYAAGFASGNVYAPWDDPDATAGLLTPGNGIAPPPIPEHLFGSADILLGQMKAFIDSDPSGSGTFIFGTSGAPYTLKVQLTDETSHAFEEGMLFTGKIEGFLTPDQISITNTFTGETTKSVVLGANRYTVTLTDFNPPGPPSTGELGSIWARVEVAPAAEAPEPGTLLLAGLGLPLLGGLLYRRRQPQTA